VIGGAVPWLLLENEEMPNVGTLDLDLGLDAEALGDGEYVTLIQALMDNGHNQRRDLKKFQLVRQVPAADGGPQIEILIDFLMPRAAQIEKNDPPLINNFAVQRADGADLALEFYKLIAIDGPMPGGGMNRVEIAICSIPALIAMKGHAVNGRHKQKDSYDIYYCIRNYPDGIEALTDACRPVLGHPSGGQGYRYMNEKFASVDGYGPTCVRQFVSGSQILGDRTPEQWQQDAFGQVDAWLRGLGLRV